jgi:hypothetical protein
MKIKDINIFNSVGFYIKGKKQWLNLSVIQLPDSSRVRQATRRFSRKIIFPC